MKSSEILREAKNLIPIHFYICRSIDIAVWGKSKKDNRKAIKLKRWISDMLGGHLTVITWLKFGAKIEIESDFNSYEYRKLWLYKLIAICESEGD